MPSTPVFTNRVAEKGIGFTSKAVNNVNLFPGDAPINIQHGFAFGFQLIPVGVCSPFMFVNVRGVGKVSNDVLTIVPGMYYDMPFDTLDFVADPAGLNIMTGSFICNIAMKPTVQILPVMPQPILPAASGGAPDLTELLETDIALTRTPPVLANAGGAMLNASMFSVGIFVTGASPGQTITGGTIDLYRLQASRPIWVLAAQGIAIPTGFGAASIPVDYLGPREPVNLATGAAASALASDRLFVATNAVTLSGAGTVVDILTRFQ